MAHKFCHFTLASLAIALLLSITSFEHVHSFITPSPLALALRTSAAPTPTLTLTLHRSQASDDNDYVEEDWRDFRARLVMQERQGISSTSTASTSTSTSTSTTDGNASSSWAYETGQTIEKGSIILSRCPSTDGDDEEGRGTGTGARAGDSGLSQQYFHKSIILVLEHNENVFTKGIILNRPSNLILSDEDFENADGTPLEDSSAENEWKAWFGGEVNGIMDEEPEIICLHSLPDDLTDEESEVIMKGIKVTSLVGARSLVNNGIARAEDFKTFIGFCGWDAGQLKEELDSGHWYMVAADSKTLLDELKKNEANDEILDAGIESWNLLMRMIGTMTEDEIEINNSKERQSFDDLMLREWTKERLLFPDKDDDDNNNDNGEGMIDEWMKRATSSSSSFGKEIGVGTVLRASPSVVGGYNPFLLSDQEYHQSILLIIQDDREISVGVILNLPSSTPITMAFTETRSGGIMENSYSIPERYGGRFSDSSSDDEDSLLWFHCNDDLKEAKIGNRLGSSSSRGSSSSSSLSSSSTIWTISPEDAVNAIATGKARAEDFIVVSGLSVWEKSSSSSSSSSSPDGLGLGGGLAGGIQGEVNNNLFEIIDPESIESVWDILLEQKTMSGETLDENLSFIEMAWSEGGSAEDMDMDMEKRPSEKIFNSDVTTVELANEALRKWISAFLLDG